MLRTLSIFMTAAFLFFCSFARAEEAPTPPIPSKWVTDNAGFLSPETQQTLEKRLQQYEKTAGMKVALWIGTTAGEGTTLETWTSNTVKTWSEREKAYGQGIVMFIMTQDHAIHVEVAAGLEKRVPDEFVGQMIWEHMAPRLDKGDANGALTAGMEALLARLETTKSPVAQRQTAPQSSAQPTPSAAPQATKPSAENSPTSPTKTTETAPVSRRPSMYLLVALGGLILMTTVLVGVIGWPRKANKQS